MKLNINTEATRAHTNRLEKMHRSGLPLAIRGTLNSAAFDVKQRTMPRSAKETFTERNKTFFKANSRVDMARGFNTTTMRATVGFIENKLRGGANFAVKDLEQQEYGGVIKGRSFIPTDEARGGSNAKPVRPSNRLSKIRKVVDSKDAQGKTKAEKFTKSALHVGRGGYVISNFPGNRMLYKITSIRKTKKGTKIKKKAVYSFEKNRSVRVSGTGFMREASMRTGRKMERMFQKEAERQIRRLS